MRKITNDSVSAFFAARNFKRSNMEVVVEPNVTIMKLHGNSIAFRYNDPERTLSITNCGWQSNTTKERLNGILDHLGMDRIRQRNFVWYLGEHVWEGQLIDVVKLAKDLAVK